MPVSTDEMPASADSVTTDGTDSVAGGNQVVAPVEVPVTVGGNAVSVIGDSHTENATTTGGNTGSGTGSGSIGDVETDGTDSILGGNQAIIPIAVPVTIGGNAVSVIGDSHTENATTTGGSTGTGTIGDVETDGTDSILGGNQAIIPVAIPVTIGGNAVSVIGDSHTENATTTGGSTGTGTIGGVETDGTDSILGGNQAIIPVAIPVTIGGNAVSGVGDSTSTGATTTGGAGGGGVVGASPPTAPAASAAGTS